MAESACVSETNSGADGTRLQPASVAGDDRSARVRPAARRPAVRGGRRSGGEPRRLLVIDDDRRRASDTARWACGLGWRACAIAEVGIALERLARERFDAVIVDAWMTVSSSVPLVRVLRESFPDLAIVATLPGGGHRKRQDAGVPGADAVVVLPATDATLADAITGVLAARAARAVAHAGVTGSLQPPITAAPADDPPILIGRDPLIEAIRGMVSRIAPTRATVLVTGESGTGKSLVAREIHRTGNRRTEPFVEVACGALSDQLLESELFGHAAGAFTGATAAYAGRFLQADGGTIFLDEIGTASPSLQVRLLRVLQDRRFEPVGAGQTREVDVRLVLATNESLSERVAEGSFREDLYWRINVVTIHMPSLRERIGDVPLLAARFAEEAARDAGRPFEGFSHAARERLLSHLWPGNVRELRHVVERAVYLGDGAVIGEEDLTFDPAPGLPRKSDTQKLPTAGHRQPSPVADTLRQGLEEPERRLILEALSRSGGCRREAARALGINRTSLYRKFKRLGIDPGNRTRATGSS